MNVKTSVYMLRMKLRFVGIEQGKAKVEIESLKPSARALCKYLE